MTMYTVRWEIDVDAESPVEAAREALRIQRDSESIALVFEVAPVGQLEPAEAVDLWEEVQ